MLYYRHDAADRPHVDGAGVVGGAQQDLGRPVPARAHVVRDLDDVRQGAENVLRLK